MGETNGSRSSRNAKLSMKLAAIEQELRAVDEEMVRLRQRRAELHTERALVESEIEYILNPSTSASGNDPADEWDTDNFKWSSEARDILKNIFHLPDFRQYQRAAMNAVLQGEDAIVVMSTGAGKSLCYQLPAVLTKGLTVVISPLISLIEDQLTQLQKLGIEAATLNASTGKDEAKRIDAAITQKSNLRLLYITPEKLAKSKRLMNKLEKSAEGKVLRLIAVDEVHCCSSWGHDFRPDYKFLNVLKRQFPDVPLLGLTATATEYVLNDVKDMLGIKAAVVFRAGFNRPNLRYEVMSKPANEDECVELMARVIKERFPAQSGIIYCLYRNDSEKVAEALRKTHKISALHYHANMESHERSLAYGQWISGRAQVIVATVAFGMGIDKPDVRFVFHHSLPKSVENYYQESGRAGRDFQPAVCVLFYRFADIFKQSVMVQQEKTGKQKLYEMVDYATQSSSCRRASLAEHFEEQWESSWCNKACDVCDSQIAAMTEEKVDIRPVAQSAAKIIRNYTASGKQKDDSKGRITANKLMELISKEMKGHSKKFLESALVHLLLNEYLVEEFHYTTYSIISYINVQRMFDRKVEEAIWMQWKGKAPHQKDEGGEKRKSVVAEREETRKKKKRAVVVEFEDETEVDAGQRNSSNGVGTSNNPFMIDDDDY